LVGLKHGVAWHDVNLNITSKPIIKPNRNMTSWLTMWEHFPLAEVFNPTRPAQFRLFIPLDSSLVDEVKILSFLKRG
jgi:hypothetical protein